MSGAAGAPPAASHGGHDQGTHGQGAGGKAGGGPAGSPGESPRRDGDHPDGGRERAAGRAGAGEGAAAREPAGAAEHAGAAEEAGAEERSRGRRAGRVGRRPATTAANLEHLALQLFSERGFDATTVDDIAAAAGIGRRTFFRYYASKNDVAWGAFDAHLEVMRAALAASPPDEPMLEVLRRAILDFNTYPPEEMAWLRRRMTLILRTPALQAHSALRYRAWRQVVAEYVARRVGQPESALLPQALAAALLGIAMTAYEQWLDSEDEDLVAILDRGLRLLMTGFDPTGQQG